MSAYREGGGGISCPECEKPMLGGEDQMSCASEGCGDWWARRAVERQVEWTMVELIEPYRLFGATKELPCPACGEPMTVSLRAKIEFAHCAAHGLWLPRVGRNAFAALGGWSGVLATRRR
ncbi:MAG TPA: hypothetical protein VGC41_26115 [Kofleriaceae bacterium]